ncbi:MAG TPA: chain length determinant protein EpsF [Burkholderiaceae bacterium]|nr:chain length determinant protein EpsF [Burkholderiaceae bacterium]
MSINQIISILRARWIIFVVFFGFAVMLAVAANSFLPKKYTSTAALLLDVKSPDPMIGMILPAMMTPGYMATQVDLITSERVAIQAIRTLKLDQNAQLKEQWQDATDGLGSFESWLADLLNKNLSVKPSRESNVITVSYAAADPKFAAMMANAFAQSYIDVTAELRTDPAQKFETIFSGLSARTRERLEKAQARLSEYQQKHGLIATDERMDIELARLADLSQQVTILEGLKAESGGRQVQASRAGDSVAEVLGNPVIAALKADMARMEAKLQEFQTYRGDAHPQVIDLKANIAALRSRINVETGRVTSSVASNNSVNVSRVTQVQASLEAQRKKVLEMRAQRDQASVLVRDVDQLQKAYDVIQSRAMQSGMEGQNTQTNVAVVQVASASSQPSSPRVLINLILGVFGGLILAFTAVLLRELTDRRVRTADDVVNELGLPLIGVMLNAPNAKSGLLGRKAQPWLMRSAGRVLISHNT